LYLAYLIYFTHVVQITHMDRIASSATDVSAEYMPQAENDKSLRLLLPEVQQRRASAELIVYKW